MKPHTPAPQCAICGASAFVELVKDESGVFWPAHPGHGLEVTQVCLNTSCLSELEKGEELPHKIDSFLKKQVCSALGLARKSGHIVAGQDDVDACFKSGKGIKCVVVAGNAGASTQRLSRKWLEKLDVFYLLDKDTLGWSLGFTSCSVVGINVKAKNARAELKRYAEWNDTRKVINER
ncbi:MAG: hypothetical protein OSB62_05960 [Alphaproteobacteria bacterium]|nr:hypothetical protein [Alphaproteobacteria bacterium]